jgi:hypothetical protein
MAKTFEFGETTQSEAFWDRNPKFLRAFERLVTLTNKCFVRISQTPITPADELCFNLGETCRQDFLEILFLAVNGYGVAAAKLLRGLYERAVTMAYIMKHPEKAERFRKFAEIQHWRAVKGALSFMSEEDLDKGIAPFTVGGIRESYEKVKPEFPGRALSWDIDFASMVRGVGGPFPPYYTPAYTNPTLHIHATLASLSESSAGDGQREERNWRDCDATLMIATHLFLGVIRFHDEFFSLSLSAEIEACESDTNDVWDRLAALTGEK